MKIKGEFVGAYFKIILIMFRGASIFHGLIRDLGWAEMLSSRAEWHEKYLRPPKKMSAPAA